MIDAVGKEVRRTDLGRIDALDHFLQLGTLELTVILDEQALMDGRRQHEEVASELFRRLVHEFRDLNCSRTVHAAFDSRHPHG